MKKKPILVGGLIGVVILIAVALILILPSGRDGGSSGTFAKINKFRKSQMTEKDVQLRSALTADTAKLGSMIRSLAFFTFFSQDLCNKIDSCTTAFTASGYAAGAAGYDQLEKLREYAAFIRNNNVTMGQTISLLSGFYDPESSDPSVDVEKNLREFTGFVRAVEEREPLIGSALKGMDGYLSGGQISKNNREEIKRLKSVRDQLLIKGTQMAGVLGNPQHLKGLLDYCAVAQQEYLKFFSEEKLNIYASSNLSFEDEVREIVIDNRIDLEWAETLDLTPPGGGARTDVMAYDREKLAFYYVSGPDLNNYGSTLLPIAATSPDKLQVLFTETDRFNIVEISAHGPLKGLLGEEKLNLLVGMDFDIRFVDTVESINQLSIEIGI